MHVRQKIAALIFEFNPYALPFVFAHVSQRVTIGKFGLNTQIENPSLRSSLSAPTSM